MMLAGMTQTSCQTGNPREEIWELAAIASMMGTGPDPNEPGPQRGFMANDKKPKKAKPPVVHGATSRGTELSSKLAEPVKKSPLASAKKKK
jgi:hypothetical protein